MSNAPRGWAVRIDGAGYRAVDCEFADPANPEFIYPDYTIEYFMAEVDGPPPDPVPLPAQVEAAAISLLDAKQRQATLQISAIQSRIDAINDAIEFEEELPEEVEELPVRAAQLKVWKKYRIDLGRVTSLTGWYQSPAWPSTPIPYNSEMSASSLVS